MVLSDMHAPGCMYAEHRTPESVASVISKFRQTSALSWMHPLQCQHPARGTPVAHAGVATCAALDSSRATVPHCSSSSRQARDLASPAKSRGLTPSASTTGTLPSNQCSTCPRQSSTWGAGVRAFWCKQTLATTSENICRASEPSEIGYLLSQSSTKFATLLVAFPNLHAVVLIYVVRCHRQQLVSILQS